MVTFKLYYVYLSIILAQFFLVTLSSEELLLFIYVTSGPKHAQLRTAARETWLSPCKQTHKCDYRFFIDATKQSPIHGNALKKEFDDHGDLVFRDSCNLMTERHADEHINYGNSPPVDENMSINETIHAEGDVGGANAEKVVTVALPNYHLRVMYKVDWKVCFLRWAYQHNAMASYHLFVEDDSFVCTGNVLHQTSLLRSLPPAERGFPFRTGTPMYDGYDDSSTFMSKEVALAFALHYPEPGFNCTQIIDTSDPVTLKKYVWLSWGNSWMHNICYWTEALSKHLNLTISEPLLNCFLTAFQGNKNNHKVGDLRYTYKNPYDANVSAHYPCMDTPLIFHHHQAALKLSSSPHFKHMCEYTLVADKVKEPSMMYNLWYNATAQNYHDFTPIFTHKSLDGWLIVLKHWFENEGAACFNQTSASSTSSTSGTNSITRDDSNSPPLDASHISPSCQRFRQMRRLRSLKVRHSLYNDTMTLFSPLFEGKTSQSNKEEDLTDPGLWDYVYNYA